MHRRLVSLASAVLFVCLTWPAATTGPNAADALPSHLTDTQFWTLIDQMSEPNGTFRSDNLLSNEVHYQEVIPALTRMVKPGRIYMGVGPEQNFTYIVAIKPAMAFIVDVRRGNLQLHLMYKALFELAADRADFISMLFSKKRPPGLTSASTIKEIMTAFWNVETDDALYKQNVKAITDQLTVRHHLPLTPDDTQGIVNVYHAFYWYGPSIMYSSTGGFGGRYQPTYAELLVAEDEDGVARGFLSTEQNFAWLKELEKNNLLVPLVGNFAGPKAIRDVGRYLREHGAILAAFYLSNVEQYLNQEDKWRTFCANVATLPLDDSSTFIRSVRSRSFGWGFGLVSELGPIAEQVRTCN